MAEPTINKILVAVRNRDDGEIVLDKAKILAQHAGASLHVLRAVYDEFAELSIHDIEKSEALKAFLLKAEETMLEELIEPLASEGVDIESATVWHKAEWQALLGAAEDCRADLIVKGTQHPVTNVLCTPSDWNLLRHAKQPVMLLKPVSWVQRPIVLAAVDMAEENEPLNERILARADRIRRALNGKLHVINVFPSVEHWVGPITVVVDFEHIRKDVSHQIEARIKALLKQLGLTADALHVVDGETEHRIQQCVAELNAELLVMGTHRRDGAHGLVLGNTSEKILDTVRCDVEVLG